MGDQELDVRPLRKPDKHPAIFRAYAAVPVGESLVLVNDHDPRHLRDEFELEHPGGYAWEYLSTEPRAWRIRITKLASTPLPRILAETSAIGAAEDATGAVWKLQMRERDLDSNIIALAPGETIGAHAGPDLDVLICVLAGSGELTTELGTLALRGGSLCWLPRRSRRQFTAGPDGLRYLTVHQRRQALTLATTPCAKHALADQAVTSYLRRLAERSAAPAGGAAAALNVAQAAALLAMSARFCDGPKHAEHAGTVDEIVAAADRSIRTSRALMDADGESYSPVLAAYQLPKDTEEQRAARSAAIAAALVAASGPAAEVIAAAARLLELAEALQPIVNRSIAPDVAAAVEAIRAAIGTSATNVAANLSGITDPAARDRLTAAIAEADALEARAGLVVAAIRSRYAGQPARNLHQNRC
jgi:formiminotetrahydrofolate cyclodeaminase/uncharacterized protein (DUF2249 family)/quercetin dioxygenase-like cupin family protein